MTKKHKLSVFRMSASSIFLVLLYFIQNDVVKLCFFTVAYFIIGYDILAKSLRNIYQGQIFDENFLMSIATVGAIFLGEYSEAVFVMLFYQIGELFQSIAIGKSRRSIAELMKMSPDFATVIREGKEVVVEPEELMLGEQIIVRPGEKIPVDAVIIKGTSSIDTANLTGEAVPYDVFEGDKVLSGCINLSGVLWLKVEKEFSESTVSKILELVENASESKSSSESFITKFAKFYTPFVVVCALIVGIIVPVFMGGFSVWLHRALMFLVISCPCALVISVPLSFFGGIGCASKNGILIKGSNFIETLAKCRIIAFDKTGTLTEGKFFVSDILIYKDSRDEVLKLAAYGEYFSNHPIARSIVCEYNKPIDETVVTSLKERAGRGVVYYFNNERIAVGNKILMSELGIEICEEKTADTIVYVSRENELLGEILINDRLKPTTKQALLKLKKLGVKQQIMLTGDRKSVAESIGNDLGLTKIYSELLPDEKVSCLEKILSEKIKNGSVAYVGDGVNDAPSLTRAEVGIAMGALGSDAAIEAADIVLMEDDLDKVPTAISISKKTMSIVKQNIVFAIGVKFLVMVLGVCGLASMWGAVFADVGVSALAIINSIRALTYKIK